MAAVAGGPKRVDSAVPIRKSSRSRSRTSPGLPGHAFLIRLLAKSARKLALARQLNIRSDEAYEIAARLARRTGRSRADIVLAALLSYAEAKTGENLTSGERAFVDEIIALARRQAPTSSGASRNDQAA